MQKERSHESHLNLKPDIGLTKPHAFGFPQALTRLPLIVVALFLVQSCAGTRSRAGSGAGGGHEDAGTVHSAAVRARPSNVGVPVHNDQDSGVDPQFFDRFVALLPNFGMRFARSPEDDGLTSLVDKHMRSSAIPFPRTYDFLVSKRGDSWRVSVIDMEGLRNGRTRPGVTFNVGVRKGRLRVLFQEF